MPAGKIYVGAKSNTQGLNKRQEKEVKQILGKEIEQNYASFEFSGTVPTTGALLDASAIPRGEDDGERVGDAVRLKKIMLSYNIIAAHDATFINADPYNVLRVLIFRWRMDDAVDAPTVAKVLDTSTSGSVYPTNYMLNYQNRKKYKILYDRCHVIANTAVWDSDSNTAKFVGGVGSSYNTPQPIEFYGKKMGKQEITFNDTATTGMDKLYILLVSDSTSGDHPDFACAGHLHYTDA